MVSHQQYPAFCPAFLSGLLNSMVRVAVWTLLMLLDELSSLISIYLEMRVADEYSSNSVVKKATNRGFLLLVHQECLNSTLDSLVKGDEPGCCSYCEK